VVYRVQSKKSISEVARDLEVASQRHKFGVLMVHDLKAKMKEKGVEFDRDCLIFEVCNAQQAKKVLEKNAEISTALPCRISVYQEGGRVALATIKPTVMLEMFKEAGLKDVAQEVERTLFEIMQEAAR
jgi:uncharacterized protein (DUF302 family)